MNASIDWMLNQPPQGQMSRIGDPPSPPPAINDDPSKSWFNTTLIPGLGAASGLVNGWLGLQQLDLSKDAFAFNKNLAEANFQNQAASVLDSVQQRVARDAAKQGQSFAQAWSEFTNRVDNPITRLQGSIGGGAMVQPTTYTPPPKTDNVTRLTPPNKKV